MDEMDEMDANHGSVFEPVGFIGVVLLALGTVSYYYSSVPETSKQCQLTTQPNLSSMLPPLLEKLQNGSAGFGCLTLVCPILHQFLWVRTSNEATRIIGHVGKLTHNVRHLAIQTNELQSIIGMGHMALCCVGSANNKADHSTKMLVPDCAFHSHTSALMGEWFITPLHLSELICHNGSMLHEVLVVPRNEEDSRDDGFCHSARCICPSVRCKFPNLLHFPTCNFSICGSFSLCNNLINCQQ
jgi:hypothetical protein